MPCFPLHFNFHAIAAYVLLMTAYRKWQLTIPRQQGSWCQHGAHLGRDGPDGPHVGLMNLVIRDGIVFVFYLRKKNHRQKNTSLLAHYLSATINNTNLVSHTHSCGSIFILFRQTLVNPVFHDDVIKWEHFPRYWRYRPPMNSPAQGPVTRSFDVFSDLHLNNRLSKQSWGWWFETPSRPLWRHSNVL